MKRTLQLVWDPGPAPPSTPEAWFLTGDDPSAWLTKLVETGLAQTSTQLFIVPRSISDAAPAGVLALPDTAQHPITIARPPSAWACRCLAGRVYVPVHASLHPPVSDAELIALCTWPIAFFHPVFGLSGFDQESRVTIEQWLVTPAVSLVAWNHARPGPPPLPALNRIQVRVPEQLASLYGDAASDIGTQPPHEIPAAPSDPTPGTMGRWLRAWLRRFPRLPGNPPTSGEATSPPATPANGIAQWIHRRLAPATPPDAKAQQRTLERLVHLLDADPDTGLRHAPPITSLGQQGWTSEPVGDLTQRKPDFNLDTLSGGPAAAWNVSPSLLEMLRLRYRELADRELRLGRFRRAAYIYAHLLGDLVSATHALKRGGHFHEAAILYDTQLHNPLEAARCLVAGGFLEEALPRLEQLARWFEIAEIHQRLGNSEAAAAAFRREAADQLQQGSPVGAALILSGKLQAHDEALALLDAGWSHSTMADRCLELSFQLRAELGRHDETLQRLRSVSASPIPERLLPAVTLHLVQLARTYPDPRVRHLASDLVRCLVGNRLALPPESSEELRRQVEPLFQLAPEDRLFSRDVNRFVLQRLRPGVGVPTASTAPGMHPIRSRPS